MAPSPGKEISIWDDNLPLPKLNPTRARTVVFCLAVLCFFNSFDGEFVFDDAEAIVNNKDANWYNGDIRSVFWHDFWGADIRSNSSHKSYRPLTTISFRLNNLVTGLDAKSYHVVNIFLHALVSAIAYDFFATVFGAFGKSALLAALLFATHPVHTECVSNVAGRAELLSALFFLTSFLCYNKELQNYSKKWIFLSIFSAFLSMLCKEQGITVLGVCLVFDLLRLQSFSEIKLAISRCFSDYRNNNNWQKRTDCILTNELLPFLKRCVILCICGVVMLFFRFWIMDFSAPKFTALDNPASFHDSSIIRTINYNYLFSLNLWLLVNPSQLCFDYSMGCIPLITQWSDPRLLCVLSFWIILLLVICYCLPIGSNFNGKRRTFSFAFATVFIPFLPASNLLFRVGFVLAERVLYLPSLGYCMTITIGCVNMMYKLKLNQKILTYGLYSFLVLYSAKSMLRSDEWRSEHKLFQSGARVCPGNAKVHYNLGKVLSDSGHQRDAELKYRHALQLHPGYEQAMNNLANLLENQGGFAEAEQLLLKAVRIRPDFTAAWMNLGIVQTALRKYSRAENAYLTALKYRTLYPDCYFNLGNLYLSQKRYSEALWAWRNATNLKPTHSKAWTNQVILLDNQGIYDKAIRISKEALKFVPREAAIHFSLASCLGKINNLVEAERHFQIAIKLEPDNGNFYGNLGVLYHRWQKRTEAEAMYLMALRLDPALKTIETNLNMLRNSSRNRLR